MPPDNTLEKDASQTSRYALAVSGSLVVGIDYSRTALGMDFGC